MDDCGSNSRIAAIFRQIHERLAAFALRAETCA